MRIIIKLFLFLGLVLLSIDANAQVGIRSQFYGEFRVGLNSTDMDIKNGNRDKDLRIGFHLAAMFTQKLFFTDFQLQSGVIMTKKGMKQSTSTTVSDAITGRRETKDIESRIDLNYVEVPLMLGYEFYLNDEFSININGGGYAACGFKGYVTDKGTISVQYGASTPLVDEYYRKVKSFESNNFKRFDFGLIGSVGLVYDVFTFNLNYEYGLSNVADDGVRDMKNRNLTASVGVRF